MLARFTRTVAVAATLAVSSAALANPALAQKPVSKAQDAAAKADARAIERYRLTPALLTKISKVQDNIYAMLKADPTLAKKYANMKDDDDENGEDAQTIDEMAKKLNSVPELKRAIAKAGLTSREYMIASLAMFQASMATALAEMPGADKSAITPTVKANMAFLKAHKAEMDRMNARALEIQKLTGEAKEAENDESEQEPDTTGGVLR